VHFLPLGHSCPLQTILLSEMVMFDSPLQIVMAFWGTIMVSRGHTRPRKLEFKQKECQTAITMYLQKAVIPDRMGSIASDNVSGRFYSRVEKPSDDINIRLCLINKKGLFLRRFAQVCPFHKIK
jgi:hypothetical protein